MQQINKKYLFLLLLGFLAIVLVEYFTPESISWKDDFSKREKIPYGCYVLYQTLPDVFEKDNIKVNNKSYYEFLENQDSSLASSILIVTNDFSPDKLDLSKLLQYVESGKNIFLSSIYYGKDFLDTLKLVTKTEFGEITLFQTDTMYAYFVSSDSATGKKYYFKRSFFETYFSSFDTVNTTIIGESSKKHANFISVDYGDGKIYINTLPRAFSNYGILYNNREYAYKTLSYLPNEKIVWDEYYKPSVVQSGTPLKIMLGKRALKNAYYLLLLTLLIYILFDGKRKQRIIPIIDPPKNTSLEFVETLGMLYFHKKNHRDIAVKKFNNFIEYIYTKYYLKYNEDDALFLSRLQSKSGTDIVLINTIFEKASEINKKHNISEKELIFFHDKIEEFYKNNK